MTTKKRDSIMKNCGVDLFLGFFGGFCEKIQHNF